MQWVLTTLTVATGVLSLLGTLSASPFTPARFWSWQLRKHMENVKAIDAARQPNQHEILMKRADYLVDRVAAAYHIRADRQLLRLATLQTGIFVYVAVALVLQWIYLPDQSYLRQPVGVLMIVSYAALQALFWAIQIATIKGLSAHRAEFIAQGCPPDFPRTPSENRGPMDPSALEDAIANYRERRATRRTHVSEARKCRLDEARQRSVLMFTWVWLGQYFHWYAAVQGTFMVGTSALIIVSAALKVLAPHPVTSILLIVAFVITVAGVVPLAAFVYEVRAGRYAGI